MKISSETPAKIREQLDLLKGTTISTGAIHEAQKLQLQMWPRMLSHVKSVTSVSVSHENKLVVFNCTQGETSASAVDKKIYPAIREWVRNILWNETEIVIKLDRKVAYDSRK